MKWMIKPCTCIRLLYFYFKKGSLKWPEGLTTKRKKKEQDIVMKTKHEHYKKWEGNLD